MAVKEHEKAGAAGQRKTENGLFAKEQLASAERFRDRKDIINTLLSPDKRYSIREAEQMIEKYMKGEVK